jgi:glutamate N-acetyltransferase/amino-acid N-acetyltransferase
VKGARNREDAKQAAYAIAHSPLVKTAFFGMDANWGRILCAIGHSGIRIDPNRIDVFFDRMPIVKNGMGVGDQLEEEATEVIKNKSFTVTVHLHQGTGEFSVFTTDLSIDYVKINPPIGLNPYLPSPLMGEGTGGGAMISNAGIGGRGEGSRAICS